jgi:hypothetical protein
MPACYKIWFADTGEEIEWFGSCGYYYEFDDGTAIALHPTIAWCVPCQKFVSAEFIPELAEIEQELDELTDPTSKRASIFQCPDPPFDEPEFAERRSRLHEAAIAEAKRRLAWRRHRTAPPKCLHCGSTSVEFPGDGGEMRVTGRGLVRVEWTGMCSTALTNWFYTPEGERIPRNTKPSYWRLPKNED